MGRRSEELAREFEAANQQFVATIEDVSPEDWTALCPAENWTVGVTAHHVAYDYPILVDVLEALARGESRPLTMEMIDELNANHASQHADCTKAETLELLRQDGAAAAASIRALDDSALDTRHDLPFLGDRPVPLEQFIRTGFIDHHAAHLPSIRVTAPSATRTTAR